MNIRLPLESVSIPRSISAVVLAATLLAGCRDAPTDAIRPDESVLSQVSERPLTGSCNLGVTVEDLGGGRKRLSGRGTCELSHLGRTEYETEQIADPGPGTLSGTATFTAANGDVLRATLSGPLGSSLERFDVTAEFTGGTGRFATATGSATLNRNVSSRPGSRSGVVDQYVGTIRYDPSRGTPGAAAVALEIAPGALLLTAVGAQRQLTAYAVDAAGNRTAVSASFTSSRPTTVSVTSGGLVTAMDELGSAQIVAQALGLTSAPILVLVARPRAGALLIADEDVIGTPEAVDRDAAYAIGWKERLRLLNVVPSVGQLLIGTGGLPIAGRVTSVGSSAGGVVEVEYELIALDDLFEAISIAETIPLARAGSIQLPAAAAAFDVRRDSQGAVQYDLRAPVRSGRTVSTRERSVAAALTELKFDLGPLSCEAKLDAGVTLPITLDLFSFSIQPDLSLDLVVGNGEIQRFVVHGTLDHRIAANPLLTGAVKGSVECKVVLRVLILPIGGPISRFVGGQVPLGVGFAVEAESEVKDLGFDAFVESSTVTEFGFDCTVACQAVADATTTSGGFVKPVIPEVLDQLQTKLKSGFFGYADLQVGSPLLRELQFEVVEIKAGLEQKAELASERVQALDASYASNIKLATFVEAGTTSKVSALAGLLKVQLASFKFEPELPVLARTPGGSFTIEPGSVAAGNGEELGDQATFTVTLDPVTFLGLYSVDRVEIRWLRDDGEGDSELEPGRPGCTAIPATAGQTVFTCQADFLEEHEGQQTFFAFVKPKLFGTTLPLGLEIGSATVEVSNAAVEVTISPTSVQLQVGETRTFTAQVTGAADEAVTWTATGGTIDSEGEYTAGTTAGTFTVRATSVADPTVFAEAVVTILGTMAGSISVGATFHPAVGPTSCSSGSPQPAALSGFTSVDSATVSGPWDGSGRFLCGVDIVGARGTVAARVVRNPEGPADGTITITFQNAFLDANGAPCTWTSSRPLPEFAASNASGGSISAWVASETCEGREGMELLVTVTWTVS